MFGFCMVCGIFGWWVGFGLLWIGFVIIGVGGFCCIGGRGWGIWG